MTRRGQVACFFLAALLLLAGCEGITEPLLGLDGAKPAQECAVSKGLMELEAKVQQRLCDLKTVSDLALKEKDWRVADEKVRAYLAQHEGRVDVRSLEELASSMMLHRLLLRSEASSERTEAVAFYTDLLLENESNDYGDIRIGLAALVEHWGAARVRQAAADVVARGGAHETERLAEIAARARAVWAEHGDGLEVPNPRPWDPAHVREIYASNDLRELKALRDALGG